MLLSSRRAAWAAAVLSRPLRCFCCIGLQPCREAGEGLVDLLLLERLQGALLSPCSFAVWEAHEEITQFVESELIGHADAQVHGLPSGVQAGIDGDQAATEDKTWLLLMPLLVMLVQLVGVR